MLRSLLYVSRRLVEDDESIYHIVARSRIRNAELGLTGALIVTHAHFAQIIEGTPPAIDEIMASIRRDPRHDNLMIAPAEPRQRRDYDRWQLAYHGESSYVAGLLADMVSAPPLDVEQHTDTLRNLFAMFA